MNLLRCAASFRSVDTERRSIDVVASTDALDSHGTILEQSWRLQRYLSNPVVLWAHDSSEPPIGYAEDVRVESGQLRARVTFVDESASKLAEQIWQGVKQRSIRGLSVGFRSGTTRIEKRDNKDVVVLSDNELYEISFVAVPSNAETLAGLRARTLRCGTRHNDPLEAEVPASEEPTDTPNDAPPSEDAAEGNPMKLIATALGLPETATEAEILAHISTLTTKSRSVELQRSAFEELTGKTGSEALGMVRGWKDEAAKAATLAARNAELETRVRKVEVEDAVDAKIKLTHVPPAEREALIAIGMKDPDTLRGYLAVRNTPIVRLGDTGPNIPSHNNPDALQLTAEERTVAKAMGISEADALAFKKAELAERAQLSA